MWLYILIPFFLVFLKALQWFISPYIVWKKSYKARQQESIKVRNGEGKSMTLEEYRSAYKPTEDISVSLVIPAYNEEKRLSIMLDDALAYLNKAKISFEIIIINDGSKDKTSEVALDYAGKMKLPLVVVEYPTNRGKGGAIRAGMQLARGKLHLMVDADGATEFAELGKVKSRLQKHIEEKKNPLVMVAGSRHHLTADEEVNLKRKWYRKVFAFILHIILTYGCGITTKDTQCGFKLMTRETSKLLFETMHVERWSFDIQLFVMANHFGISCYEVAVNWQDVEGSKLNLIEASLSMFRDIVLVRTLYLIGLWKYTDKSIVA